MRAVSTPIPKEVRSRFLRLRPPFDSAQDKRKTAPRDWFNPYTSSVMQQNLLSRFFSIA
jgi:hypothetical protein